jgi:chromatin remodeling complex protein RSC6
MATLDTVFDAIKSLQRDVRKIRTLLEDPTGEKARLRSENSTFKKPLDVTDTLRSFLGLTPDEKISRADVSRKVNEYIRNNNLKNGQVVVPDEKLQNVLKVPLDELATLSSLKINKYLSPHFVKATPPADTPDKKPVRPKVKN